MAPPTVRTISRYLLRQHVAPLGFALAALTSLMLIQQIAKQLSSLLGKGLPTSVIIEVFLLAARIDGSSNKLKDVTIYDLADAERRRIITADSGRMAYSAGGRDLYLTLQDGDIEEVSRADPTQFNRTFFSTNRMRVAGVGNIFQPTTTDTYKSDREMSTCEMQEAVESARRDVESAAGDARLVIDNDLRRLAGLAPLPPRVLAAARDATLPGPYCRALRRLAAWAPPARA